MCIKPHTPVPKDVNCKLCKNMFCTKDVETGKMHIALSSSKMCLNEWCLLFCSDFSKQKVWQKKIFQNSRLLIDRTKGFLKAITLREVGLIINIATILPKRMGCF